ncbi:MAG TPA: aminoacyl-tRNA hydrolase [Mycobacteriales bacterium]|nr:aminoacyl-tRNA hydrolase [Mycobacteriales bacterium]
MTEGVWLLVGLGNPGPKYAGNRHNIGFMVVEELARRVGGSFKAHRGRADVVEGRLAGARAIVAKPKCYMNESGGPVTSLRDFFKIPAESIVTVTDEIDLPFATLRLKLGGGDNGHNGLKSVTRSLGTPDYHRLRVGVDRPRGQQDPADYVLNDFSAVERRELPFLVDRAADAIEALISDGLAPAQNRYHPPDVPA